jgi:TonB family protein
MQYRRFLLFTFSFLFTFRLASAQEVLSVDKLALNQHVDHRIYPVYPPIAKAARIQGTVEFEVRIGITGQIESMKVISGPAMLQQAAMDALKQWTYHPFEKDGKPVVALGPVSLMFSLGGGNPPPGAPTSPQGAPTQTVVVEVKSETPVHENDPMIERQFQESDQACKDGVLSKRSNDSTISSCKHAAELADKMQMEDNYVAKRSAFVYAATAFANNGNLKGALHWATKAAEVVKLGHDDDSGSNAAYSTKGTIEGYLGDLTDADQDLTLAEDYERKGIAEMEKDSPGIAGHYRSVLARDLRFHAQVLQRLNRPDEAQKKLDEAAKLNGPGSGATP